MAAKAARKKVVATVELVVKLDAAELSAFQGQLDTERKPTAKALKDHFNEILDQHIDDVLSEHGEDPEA